MAIYDREKAVRFALKYWNKRNIRFYDFEKLGGDCTNFVSQCLFYGGIAMDKSKNGWYYNSLFDRAPAWTGVKEFFNYGILNQKDEGIKLKICKINEVEIGDVVQFDIFDRGFHHTAIITKIIDYNFDNIFIVCHSSDAKNKALSKYKIKNIRFLKVIN